MKKQKAGLDAQAEPTTVEATVLWSFPDRIVSMCAKGLVYTWITNKQEDFYEGDQVFVNFDKVSNTVYSMALAN